MTPVETFRGKRVALFGLGGSGFARPFLRMPTVPALLKPLPTVFGRAGSASEYRAKGV